ncbi:MAG: putative acetyltransferase [Pseudohongiellaceae bacterium]|jgi:predicted acetyltransferase
MKPVSTVNRDLYVGLPLGLEQRSELLAILCKCFRAPAEHIEKAASLLGDENLRVVAKGDRVLGGLWCVPKGQFFGGRSVPMEGVAAVGTDPAQRGQRAASTLMAGVMKDLRGRGVALSTLYPATMPLYRGAGFELAGNRFKISLPLRTLDVRAKEPDLREAGPGDYEAMSQCYGRFARERNGYLDRAEYNWRRLREPKNAEANHYVVEENGRVEGYLSMVQVDPGPEGFYDLSVLDVIATTPGAARRLLAFLSSHKSMACTASYHGGAFDPLLAQLPEWRAEVTVALPWMLRIVHLEQALTARGYPPGLTAEVHLQITDDVLPENAGRHCLIVENGVGRVAPGGEGSLVIDIRGLAALYSGRASPDDLRLAGLASGSSQDWALAAAIFAGPAPAMADMF